MIRSIFKKLDAIAICTCDHDLSYDPTIHCGDFVIVLNDCADDLDDSHGIFVNSAREEAIDHETDVGLPSAFTLEDISKTCFQIAVIRNHRDPELVRAAAVELWLLLQSESDR